MVCLKCNLRWMTNFSKVTLIGPAWVKIDLALKQFGTKCSEARIKRGRPPLLTITAFMEHASEIHSNK
jgi:hypothetical protein